MNKLQNSSSYLLLLILFSMTIFSSCSENKTSKTQALESVENEPVEKESKKTILFFGNSLTAGYGIDKEDSFAGLTQQRLDSLGLDYRVINGGLSGETTAGGFSRLDWFLEEEPYIFVLELGGNDGLRGIQLSETRSNLEKIIDEVRNKYPETHIILAGMQIPPNMGQEYTDEFKYIYPEVAAEKERDTYSLSPRRSCRKSRLEPTRRNPSYGRRASDSF